MDTQIQELVVGAASNALWSLVANVAMKTAQAIRDGLAKPDIVMNAVESAVASVSDHFALGVGPERDRLVSFLRSPELESIVRQLYCNRLVGKETASEGSADAIRREFLELISLHLDIKPETLQAAADPLFHALVSACNVNLARTIGQNPIGAHEALSQYRHRRLLDELAVIEKNLAVLARETKPDIQQILGFEEQYRRQVGARHSYIQPPHFDSARKVPVDDLFVTPTFYLPNRRKRRPPSLKGEVSIEAFANSLYRVVVIGNPGGGKSTLATKFVHDMATKYSTRPVAGRHLTPILVVLREYGRLKKAQNCSILQAIEIQANSNYQVNPPAEAFEYLLLNGRVLVIFDGLDELLDTSYRQEVSGDIESFCSIYPNVPVLITSREVGYEQAPLDEEMFTLFGIAPFDEQQVADYSDKWFARDDDYSFEQRKQKAKAFLSESEVAPDLRSNPLMLGLMCNLYKVEGYIPRNRADVYEKCSIMLFERWDKGRGIVVQLPFEAHVRPAMEHLAYWIYSEESLQAGVTQERLIEQTKDYLLTWVFDNYAEARRAAEEFVAFCTGRAWVFTDTGTTAEGEKLYQFTHRTFLEYFTSSYLASIHPTPAALGGVLYDRIRKEEWDVVALLAFQLQSRRVRGAADVLLEGLLKGWSSIPEQAVSIAFAGRCLEFLVPSPKVRRAIAAAALNFAVECGDRELSINKPKTRVKRHRAPSMIVLRPLVAASIENRATLAEVFHELMLNKILGSCEDESLAALDIAMHPARFEWWPHKVSGDVDSTYWRDTFGDVVRASQSRMKELAVQDLTLCTEAVMQRLLSMENLLDWHGFGGIFAARSYRRLGYSAATYSGVLVGSLVSCAAGDCSPQHFANLQDDVARLGRWLSHRDTPWLDDVGRLRFDEYQFAFETALTRTFHENSRRTDLRPNDIQPDTLFGAFCLFAVVAEVWGQPFTRHFGGLFGNAIKSNLILVPRLASARLDPIGMGRFGKLVGRCGFSGQQSEFIRKWIDGEISFTTAGAGFQPALFHRYIFDSEEIIPEAPESGSQA